MIAVVLHVIVFAVMGIWIVTKEREPREAPPTSIEIGKKKAEDEKPPEEKPEELVDRKAIPKPDVSKESELVDPDRDVGLTAPVVDGPQDLSKEAGDPTSSDSSAPSGGTSIGAGGKAAGGHFGRGPSAYVSRSGDHLGNGNGPGGRASGPTQRSEAAVRAGQLWLIRHQQPDGSWAADKMKNVCDAGGGCCPAGGPEFTAQYNEGLTGLALLAFFGSGQTDESKMYVVDTLRKRKTYLGKDVILPALKWLRARQDAHKDGRFCDDGHIYNEALATFAMCEAYGLTHRMHPWGECAQRGIDFLVSAQRLNPSGTGLWGWRYEPRGWIEGPEGKAAFPDPKDWNLKQHEADVSATAWVVMALKSAELAGLNVPEPTMQGAMDFVRSVTTKDGRVAYMDVLQVGRPIRGEGDEFMFHPTTLDALGMCVRTFVEKNVDDPVLDQSAALVVNDLPTVAMKETKENKAPKDNKLGVDYYYWYYASLALYQLDGPGSPKQSNKYWKKWNNALIETLLPLQDEGNTCARGSWTTPDRWSYAGGPIYRTAINVLTLEVYYRYENAFGTSVAAKKPGDSKGREEKGREDEKKPK